MIDERAMFRDLYACLRWAWYGAADAASTVKGPSWAKYQREDQRDRDTEQAPRPSNNPDVGGVPRGWTAAGQAGAIKRHVLEMPNDMGCHVIAKFLRGRERAIARRELRRYVSDYIGAEGVDRRAVGLLLLGYYGISAASVLSVSEKLEIDRRRVTKLNRRMVITLDALGFRAESSIYDELQKRGVIL